MGNQAGDGQVLERAFEVADPRTMEALNRSEIDTQITTAKKFPRSVTRFQAESTSLVTLSEATAEECIYALPRFDRESGENKTIEGPSARFGEILAYSWGNCRVGARVVDEAGDFVTAQGVYWDLEKNTAIGYEVKRRIVNKSGKRFSADMIGVTANAACSIALRNAILKGIPKALWSPVYEKARETIMGDFQTLAVRRETVLGNFQKFGVPPERVFEKLGVVGIVDITLEHIVTLRGMLTAIKDGDSTVEDMFPRSRAEVERGATAGLRAAAAVAAGGAGAAGTSTGTTAADAGGAESSGDGAESQESSKPAAAEKQRTRGTPKLRKTYLEKIKASSDRDVLGILYEETKLYDWSEKEAVELANAYSERIAELAAA